MVDSNGSTTVLFGFLKEMLLQQTTSNMETLRECIDSELRRREHARKKTEYACQQVQSCSN